MKPKKLSLFSAAKRAASNTFIHKSATPRTPRSPSSSWLLALTLASSTALLSACGGSDSNDEEVTYPAIADTNDEEVTYPAIADTTAPVITLNGAATIDVEYGDAYSDDSATAADETDGVVDVVSAGSVNTAALGSYTITYTATDAAGNVETLERVINVVDTTAPVITLQGDSEVTLVKDRAYNELGADALDNVDGQLTFTDIVSDLDNTTLGEYSITYAIADAAGNLATAMRSVTVIEPRPFIFTAQGSYDTPTTSLYTIGVLLADPTNPDDSFEYNYTVDWGDGTSDENVSTEITHTYPTRDIYTITISGQFPAAYQMTELSTIEQWGDIQWRAFLNSFQGDLDLISNASDDPDLSLVTTMEGAFEGANSFNHDMNSWDVSNVKNFDSMFRNNINFNQDISGWDTSSAEDFSNMFRSATSFNQDISGWDTSNVEDFSAMFEEATSFNQDISLWNFTDGDDVASIVDFTSLSVSNYDKFLIKLASVYTTEHVDFDAGGLVYSEAAEAAHDKLVNELLWDFLDTLEVSP